MGSTIRAHEPTTPTPTLSPRTLQNLSVAGGQPYGHDVSSFQRNVDWRTTAANGAKFVYVKASEGTSYLNPYFGQQYNGSVGAGMIRGAYHFALPNNSSGITQANYFVDHGGGWTADGTTLPPMLDIEYNPYGANCYGLSPTAMSSWIHDFSNTVFSRTGRYPTIYSTTDWWNSCTGSDPSFGSTNPLFIAHYSSSPGVMPAGWRFQTLWQYSDTGTFPGDADVFNGSMTQLANFAADPVQAYYRSLGGATSYLGSPVGGEYKPSAGGLAQNYTSGSIYWSSSTGAHAVHGAILARYQGLGGPAGVLGYPTTDESVTPGGTGRYNHFAGSGGSSIYWTPTTGAHGIQGAIRAHWAALGWERSALGYPTTDETVTPGGVGRYNHFAGSGGSSIYWTPTTGAHEIQGAIRARWAALGWERGQLGFPVSDEYAIPGGRRNDFVHGSIIWTPSTGAIPTYT
jgi:GH25 family lysozyme M1 (1,4-beta-N-acetylmuramidase)